MADFSIASQIKPVQLPDQLQQYAQFNQLALHQAQLAEVQRAANEQNQLRQFAATGEDLYSPAGLQRIAQISPQLYNAYAKEADARQTSALERRKLIGELAAQPEALRKSRAEAMAADQKHLTEMLSKTLAYKDDAQAAAAYDALRANAVHTHRELDAIWPKTFNRDVLNAQMLTAEQAARQQFDLAKPQFQTVKNADGSESIVRVAPGGGPATPVPGGAGAPKPGEPYQDTSGRRYQPIKNAQGEITGYRDITPGGAGAPFAPPAGAPASVMMQPTAVGAPPAVGDAQAMRTAQIEGTGKNPMSSAQGLHQFIDSTFVGTAKKVFPELASKSPAEILALRGTKLADGTPIESALEQRFRADNIASLASAGIQPTPGNVYLAHFLGAGGARNVLSADPNTPLSQVVSADAIKANPEVLAIRNKTVGDLQNWANSKFGNQPGLAASMTASNARLGGAPAGFAPAGGASMSLGAPTVNNALMASMMAGQAAPTNMLAAPAPPQLAAPAAMPVAQAPAVAPSAPAPAISDATANMSPAARAEYGKEQAKAASTQDAAKAARKEAGQNLLRTVGGDNGAKIEALIKGSTSGRLQKYAAEAVGAVTGSATPGMENIATLDQLAKQMTFDLLNGKLGANISDKDRDFVTGLVANISAPETTASERVRGFRQLQNTINAWASGKDIEIGAPAVTPEGGVPRGANGRRGTLSGTPAATPSPPPLSSFNRN
jgi:hypothetical protein